MTSPWTIWRRCARSPLADKAFRETIDYEIGVTLLEGSRLLPPAERESELEKARASFPKVPSRPSAASAGRAAPTGILANVLVERGQIKKELAAQPDRTPDGAKAVAGGGPRAV